MESNAFRSSYDAEGGIEQPVPVIPTGDIKDCFLVWYECYLGEKAGILIEFLEFGESVLVQEAYSCLKILLRIDRLQNFVQISGMQEIDYRIVAGVPELRKV